MSTNLVLLAVLMFAVTYPSRALGLLTPGSIGCRRSPSTTCSWSVRLSSPLWPRSA